jgi:hypothetical protein
VKINKIIDYLQYTSTVIPRFLGKDFLQRRSPIPFYKACNEYPCGTVVLYGNVNSDKYLIQMAGKACKEYTFAGEMLPLTTCFAYGGKVSRLDLAVTVDEQETLKKFRNVVGTEKLVSKRFEQDAPKLICSANGDVETIYIGSLKKRGKKGIFRAYDKGLEGGLGETYIRFELEVRRKLANTAAKRLNKGHSIGDLIRNVVDLPGEQWWIDMMGAKSDTLPYFFPDDLGDPVERRWHWLCTQVAPALAKLLVIEAKHGTKNYTRFQHRVIVEIEKTMMLDNIMESHVK